MKDEHSRLLLQIARCRRLADEIADDEVCQSLRELADEYETRLKSKGEGFMLQDRGR